MSFNTFYQLNKPEILMADEPTSDLDEQTEHEIVGLFAKVHHESGTTTIMVTRTSQLTAFGTRSVNLIWPWENSSTKKRYNLD